MNFFSNWMERRFVPIAAKISSEKHLIAIRDAFIAMMPVTMAGSMASLLNAIFRDIMAEGALNMPAVPEAMKWLISINGNVWWGCTAMFALVFAFSFGYHLAKAYKVNAVAGGLISFAALIATTAQSAVVTIPEDMLNAIHTVIPDAGETLGAWGNLGVGFTNASGLFTAMIIGFVSVGVFIFMTKRNIIIKMPEGVPPAVSNAFASIVPGVTAIFASGAIAYLCVVIGGEGTYLNNVVSDFIQKPFMGLAQGLPAIIIAVLAVQFLWFFGLHGTNIIGPVLQTLYGTALQENQLAHEAGQILQHKWTAASFDTLVWMGGAGTTLAFVIALIIFSKKAGEREVAKLSLAMGAFNINEPVMFGVPVVLNTVYFIPFIFVPVILSVIAYIATATGFAAPAYIGVPWVTPPVIGALLSTGGDIGAAITALVNLMIAILIWSVFVKIANKVEV